LNNSRFRFFAGKLLSKWEGPYIIEEVYCSGAIKINNAEGTNPKVVNGQRINHYISGTPINVESNIIQTMTPEELIRLQCIYNFLLFHASILGVLVVLYALLCDFIVCLGLTY
jgi:hypothetical protein